MVTDPVPRARARRAEYERSDALSALDLPATTGLPDLARAIESALAGGATSSARAACAAFLEECGRLFDVPPPGIKVLASRPLRTREGYSTELFGDYEFDTAVIRVWMRTAVQHKVTSFGTFISTLTHEFCHHLDVRRLDLPSTYHTRGFFTRAAVLYHAARGTPLKSLVWRERSDGRWQVDWQKMRRA